MRSPVFLIAVLAACTSSTTASRSTPAVPPAPVPSGPPYAGALSGCESGAAKGCAELTERILEGVPPRWTRQFAPVLDKQCRAGLNDACVGLALLALQQPNPDVAAVLSQLEQGCAQGSSAACSAAAETRMQGAEKDPAAQKQIAADALTQCERLGGSVCDSLAGFSAAGVGTPKDDARAAQLVQKACTTGSAYACFAQGQAEAEEHGAEGAKAAIGLYTQACAKEIAFACTNLAYAYLRGTGAPADVQRGIAFMDRGCALGDGSACDFLAITNRGTHQGGDPDKAYATPAERDAALRKACDLGGGQSCTQLAFLEGSKVESSGAYEDMDGVLALLQQGCDAESVPACNTLLHVAKDAIRGCEGGDAGQCTVASFVHTRGVHAPRLNGGTIEVDPAKAAQERQKACAGGRTKMCAAARAP